MGVLPVLLIYPVPGVAALAIGLGGIWTFAVPPYVFVVVPFLDAVMGDNRYNPRDTAAGTQLAPYEWVGLSLLLTVLYAHFDSSTFRDTTRSSASRCSRS